MKCFRIAAIAALSLCAPAAAAPPDDEPAAVLEASPAKAEFDALKAEFDAASRAFDKARKATTEEERKTASSKRPKVEDFLARFRAIADRHPRDPAAADCLTWIVLHTRDGAPRFEALDLLLANHLQSPWMELVCRTVAKSDAPQTEAFLRSVLEKGADEPAAAQATYALACLLKRSGEAPKFAEAETLYEWCVQRFAEVDGLGERAKVDLFELRSLAVGKTAPDIEGTDHDGVAFKLSDYRGKVVLLDFWGEW